MKLLVVAVVKQDYADSVLDALVRAGYRVTGLRSFGGFLREDSQTLLLAIEEEQRQAVLDVFAKFALPADVEVPLVVLDRLADWRAKTVHHAGATLMILPLSELIQI